MTEDTPGKLSPIFQVSYDYKALYELGVRSYHIRVGAHRSHAGSDASFELAKAEVGTVMLSDNPFSFPTKEAVRIFSEMRGYPLVGARYSEDFSSVEYDGETPALKEEEGTVFYLPYWEATKE